MIEEHLFRINSNYRVKVNTLSATFDVEDMLKKILRNLMSYFTIYATIFKKKINLFFSVTRTREDQETQVNVFVQFCSKTAVFFVFKDWKQCVCESS